MKYGISIEKEIEKINLAIFMDENYDDINGNIIRCRYSDNYGCNDIKCSINELKEMCKRKTIYIFNIEFPDMMLATIKNEADNDFNYYEFTTENNIYFIMSQIKK